MGLEEYLQRLSDIYGAIDKAYSEAQRHYGFSCKGCADNCCVTKFHHHTVVEELFLAVGLRKLDRDKLGAVISRARNAAEAHNSSTEDLRIMRTLRVRSCFLTF